MQSELDWLEVHLKILLDTCQVWPDGKVLEVRQRVDLLDGRLKIEIYSNEHAPAHFHVKYQDINASFRIDNCDKINGQISSREYSIVKYWYGHSKEKLIRIWNEIRPSNCPVGKIYED